MTGCDGRKVKSWETATKGSCIYRNSILFPMNITTEEYDSPVIAKTCGCTTNKRKVTYGLLSDSHSLCLDKKDLISAQLEACEKLSKYVNEEYDKTAVEREIRELWMALDLMT